MNLINKNKLKETLLNPPLHNSLGGMSMADVLEIIDDEPIVESKQITHAHWMKLEYDKNFYKCSNCKINWCVDEVDNCNMNYCPVCGAKMDEEE